MQDSFVCQTTLRKAKGLISYLLSVSYLSCILVVMKIPGMILIRDSKAIVRTHLSSVSPICWISSASISAFIFTRFKIYCGVEKDDQRFVMDFSTNFYYR